MRVDSQDARRLQVSVEHEERTSGRDAGLFGHQFGLQRAPRVFARSRRGRERLLATASHLLSTSHIPRPQGNTRVVSQTRLCAQRGGQKRSEGLRDGPLSGTRRAELEVSARRRAHKQTAAARVHREGARVDVEGGYGGKRGQK